MVVCSAKVNFFYILDAVQLFLLALNSKYCITKHMFGKFFRNVMPVFTEKFMSTEFLQCMEEVFFPVLPDWIGLSPYF
jgi:hypothetical protein